VNDVQQPNTGTLHMREHSLCSIIKRSARRFSWWVR